MDFELSQDHLSLQEVYRKFAEAEIKPLAKEMDETETYSRELLKKLADNEFLGIPYAQNYGGAGADVLAYAMAIEEFSKFCGTTGVTVSVHTSLGSSPISEYGNEDQKKKYLTQLASGKKIGAFGLTEPTAGTDVAGGRSTAKLQGDHYILNGSKIFTTNASFADIFIVFALTDPEAGGKGMSAFIVEKDYPGFQVMREIPRMGIRGASNCEIVFQDMPVPKENLLGKEGDGFKIAMKTLDGGRIGIAAQALGIAQGSIDEAVKYVKERQQFGKRISQFQNTQFQLADMQVRVEAARLMVYKAAVAKGKGETYGHLAAMAKLFAAETARDVTCKAVQLFGGYGYTRDFPVERMMRDAKITEIYEGTSEVQKMVVSGWMKVF